MILLEKIILWKVSEKKYSIIIKILLIPMLFTKEHTQNNVTKPPDNIMKMIET